MLNFPVIQGFLMTLGTPRSPSTFLSCGQTVGMGANFEARYARLMGFWSTVREVLAVPAAHSVAPAADRASLAATDRKAIAAEIVAAKKSTGRSHWDVGVEVAERHGVSVFDVRDEYMAELDRADCVQQRRESPVRVAKIDLETLATLDLREVPSTRMRIKGSANWVTDSARAKFGGAEYLLVREPENEFDTTAVAVYGKGRKVGYLSSVKAAGLAPILDPLAFDAFKAGGASVFENSIRLWVDVPNLAQLRQFLKALAH